MSVFFNRVPASELGTTFTHYGLFCGCVPVYLGALDTDCPAVAARNGVPEFALDLAEMVFGACCLVCSLLNPEFEPTYPFRVTGSIKP